MCHVYLMAKRALVTSLVMWYISGAPRVFDGKCALVTRLFSVPRLFNRTSVHNKSVRNKEDILHIINFYTRKMCTCMRV